MQKLVWQNANGDEINLTGGNYGITEWEGFSNASLNIQNQQVPFQDGAVFLDALIEPRELSVTLKMQDKGNLEERYRMRRELIHILNPKLGEGYLIYTNDFISKRIKCIPQIPLFETHNSDTRGTPKASLSWTVCNPYWEDLGETVVSLSKNENAVIHNNGDVPCQIKALINPISNNPIIYNRNTEKQISLTGTFTGNVVINTENGNKSVQEEVLSFKWNCGTALNDCIQKGNSIVCVGTIIAEMDFFSKKKTAYTAPNQFLKIIEAFGKYIAIATYAVYTSNDCINWERVKTFDDYEARDICYSNELGIVIMVGRDVFENDTIFYSTDGTAWSRRQIYASGYENSTKKGIVYSSSVGKFVIVCQTNFGSDNSIIFISTDGVSWDRTSVNASLNDVCYFELGGCFIAVGGSGTIFTSTDGSSWTSRTSGISNYLASISISVDMAVAVGNTGKILTSYDGISWTERNSNVSNNLSGVYYSSFLNLFTVVGVGGVILESNDGINYTIDAVGTNQNINYAVVNGERIVFVTSNGYVGISDTLSNWTITRISTITLNGICYSKKLDKYIIVGNSGKIFSSIDNGASWSEVTSDISSSLNAVVYSEEKNMFVAVGANGVILTSQNGNDWVSRTSGVSGTLSDIVYVNDVQSFFVTEFASNNSLLKSTDGVNWTVINHFSHSARYISYSEKLKMLITSSSGGGYVSTSIDYGNTFSYKSLGTSVNKIFYIDELQILICSSSNNIFISTDGVNWSIQNAVYGNFSIILYTNSENLFCGGFNGIIETTETQIENIVSSLTNQSDMTFNLEIGDNEIQHYNDNGLEISYRQKYIGV